MALAMRLVLKELARVESRNQLNNYLKQLDVSRRLANGKEEAFHYYSNLCHYIKLVSLMVIGQAIIVS